jgi:hypothetical protein
MLQCLCGRTCYAVHVHVHINADACCALLHYDAWLVPHLEDMPNQLVLLAKLYRL